MCPMQWIFVFIIIFCCFRIGRLKLIKLIQLHQRQLQRRDRLVVDLKGGVIRRLLSTGLLACWLMLYYKRAKKYGDGSSRGAVMLYYCFSHCFNLLKLWNIYLILPFNFDYGTSLLWLKWTFLFFFSKLFRSVLTWPCIMCTTVIRLSHFPFTIMLCIWQLELNVSLLATS